MAPIRNHLGKDQQKNLAYSTAGDATDFTRLPVPLMELDGKARILRTNHECAQLLDSTAKLLPGQSLFSLITGSEIKRLRAHLANARRNDKRSVFRLSIAQKGNTVELRIRRLLGNETRYVAVVEKPKLSGSKELLTVSKPNGTAPLLYELAGRLGRAESIAAVTSTVGNYCSKAYHCPAGIIFVERNGDLQMVSHWRSGVISKKHLTEKIINTGPVARAFRTGEPVFLHSDRMPDSKISRFFYRLLRRCRCHSVALLPLNSSRQRPVGVLAMVLPNVDGQTTSVQEDLLQFSKLVSGYVVRACLYDEAVAARTKAEKAIKSKDEFLSMLSHELKNPMMPILGWAVALSSGTLGADKQNVALEGIVRNIRSLNYLIEDLFDVARISSGKLRLQCAETRIQDVAREALVAVQHAVESKKLRISTDISEAIPPFMADARRLQQVLVNLLNNAVKFTPQGGAIGLQVRRRTDTVECTISDTGKGIERKFLPHVFERFRQESHSLKQRTAGLGLGLTIVREIVELHGGSVQAFSEGTDKGATFVVRFPTHKRHVGRTAVA